MDIRSNDTRSEERGSFAVIDPAIADEGAALLFMAISELAEEASVDVASMEREGRAVWVMRADKLQTFALDVAALAKAIEVLGRQRSARS